MFHSLEGALKAFDYHKPSAQQVDRISAVREAHKALVAAVWFLVPDGPDRTVAIRKVHESMMTCNKAIVCEGEVTG